MLMIVLSLLVTCGVATEKKDEVEKLHRPEASPGVGRGPNTIADDQKSGADSEREESLGSGRRSAMRAQRNSSWSFNGFRDHPGDTRAHRRGRFSATIDENGARVRQQEFDSERLAQASRVARMQPPLL
jgi:hypothetical protein